MPANRRRGFEVALCLLSICAVRCETGGNQPSDHGLSNEKDPGDPSPAMAGFFGGQPAAPLISAQNTTDPVWGVRGKVSPAESVSDNRLRKLLLLIAGITCGVVGVGIIVAAAAHTIRTRRSAQTGLQTGFGPDSLARLKRRREARFGTA